MATPTNDKGGYDYSFVNTPPDELVCKICHLPSREPYLSVCCGHTFCKTCLDDAKQAVLVDEEVKNSCPMCRKQDFTTFPNKQNERAVKSLHVFCTNKDKGCDWQGELNNIVGHLANSDGCPLEEVTCINECGLSLQRQNLSKHVDIECPRSKVTCQYCNIVGERQFITGKHHEEECPKFPLPCPNKCEINTIPRENMKVHRAQCPLEIIQCECNLSLQRQLLSKHVDTECPRSKVTCQYCNTIGERQFINGQHHKEECSKFPLSCPNNCKVGTVLRENMEAHRAKCPLEVIQCEYYEIGCKVSMARKDVVKHNKEEVENHLSRMKSEYLHTKETVTTTKNKLADAEKRIRELKSSMECRIQVVENMMFKHVWHTTLEERVISQHTRVPVTLKMSDYSKKKKHNSDWCSDTFSWELSLFDQYPELKLQVAPAGYRGSKGTHLSVQLYLVKGGCKKDFIALEHQIECQLQSLPPNEDLPKSGFFDFGFCDSPVRVVTVKKTDSHVKKTDSHVKKTDSHVKKTNSRVKNDSLVTTVGNSRSRFGTITTLEDLYIEKRKLEVSKDNFRIQRFDHKEHLSKVEREIEKREKRKRWEEERIELREKQELWVKNPLAYLHVMILNQITDSEHYCVQTDQIDLKADHFLTNKECNVLIFDSPCFVPNEVLYKSTATCRYLQDDNVYFLIKVA